MKTIFIAIFEGVASKNILRTPILTTLLSRPDIRIVLLTKNEQRIAYHKQEFRDVRICYEAVNVPRPSGANALFAWLKFFFLRTDTILLRQRARTQFVFRFWIWSFLNWLIARPSVRRIVRELDWRLVRQECYASYFNKYQPDLVVMANLFDEPETQLLREARRRNILTIGFINSWDKATARCMLRLLPEQFIVFNEGVREELIVYHDVDPASISVGGIPQYDQYVGFNPSPREVFFKKIGVDPHMRLVVYSPLGGTFWQCDWKAIDLLHQLISAGRFGKDAALLVRFPPNEFVAEGEIASRPFLRYDYPGVRFSETRGIDWDMTFAELAHLSDTLYHMSLLICYASSISVDAAVLDRPVININFSVREDARFGGMLPQQLYQMTHYRKALAAGGIRLVQSAEELSICAERYLAYPELDRDGRMRLAREQCGVLDGKAGERIGNLILNSL